MGAPTVTTLTIGGTTHRLLFRPSDLQAAEAFFDSKSWRGALAAGSMRDLAIFLWAALKHGSRNLTVADATRLIDRANREGVAVVALWNKLAEALTNSGILARDEEGDEGNPPGGGDPLAASDPLRGTTLD